MGRGSHAKVRMKHEQTKKHKERLKRRSEEAAEARKASANR